MAAHRPADAVFEGGGVLGLGLVGAAEAAEERGYRWENLAGTSVGAIIAAMLAAGYSAVELRRIALGRDLVTLLGRSGLGWLPIVGPVLNLLLRGGLHDADPLERWVADLLAAKGVRTFGDLVMPDHADPRFRYKLSVIVTDVSHGRLAVLPQDLPRYGVDPESFPVARAVRMSANIPFFFNPVRLGGSVMVDGGVVSNFPVWLFDVAGTPPWPTFGMRLVSHQEGAPRRIRGPVSMAAAVITAALNAFDQLALEHTQARTIDIPTGGLGAIDFGLSRRQKDKLYRSGREAAEQFFERWDFEAYIAQFRRPA